MCVSGSSAGHYIHRRFSSLQEKEYYPTMAETEAPESALQHDSVLDTLYINNLNEKVSINRLKRVLTLLFGRYGKVLQITAHKNLKLKGQAFITYEDPASSEKALLKLQGRPVFKKPIRIARARKSSDGHHILLNNPEAIAQRKAQKEEREKLRKEKEKQNPAAAAAAGEPLQQMQKSQIKHWKSLPPNNVLLLQNLSEEQLSVDFLQQTFSGHSGFERARLIKFRKLAFVDFSSAEQATLCLTSMANESPLGPNALLTYAKK